MAAKQLERRTAAARERCDRFDAMLEQLAGEGVRISGASRFRFYSKLMRAFSQCPVGIVKEMSVDEAMRVGIACAEAGELLEAVDMLLRAPRVEGWLPRFQVAVGGHPIPVGGADAARNAQFELVVAASCRKAGAQPIFAEPDVKVRVGDRVLAIAAKRFLSFNQFDKRTAEARDQIERATLDDAHAQGIIAFDLTAALGLVREVGRAKDVAEVGEVYSQTGRRVSDTGHRVAQTVSAVPSIRAVAVYARFSTVVTSNWSFADVRAWYCGPVPPDARVAAPLRRFLIGLGKLAPKE